MKRISLIKSPKKIDIVHITKRGETIDSISKLYNQTRDVIIQDNGSDIFEGKILYIRSKNIAVHIVKPTENIVKIAERYNVSAEHVKTLNNVNQVFIGQRLII